MASIHKRMVSGMKVARMILLYDYLKKAALGEEGGRSSKVQRAKIRRREQRMMVG